MNNEIFLMQINGLIVRIPQFLCQILELNTNRNMQLQQIEEQLSNPLTLQHMQERYADATNLAFLQDQLRIFQQNCFNNWENIDQQTRNSQIIFVSENLSNILGIAIMPIELSIQEQSHFIMSKLWENANNDVEGGYIPLRFAILEGNAPLTQLLLQCDSSNVNFQTPNNETSLHLAMRTNNIRLTELLLANGANVDVQDNGNLTALYNAVDNNNLVLTSLLLEAGADPNLPDEESEEDLPLHRAVHHDNLLLVQLLLENGADPNLQNENSETPLHLAMRSTNVLPLTRCLLAYATDINAQNDNEETALNIAVRCVNYDAVHLLVTNGADVTILDSENQSPIYLALLDDDLRMIKLFIQYGGDINCSTSSGDTPLHLAINENDFELAELFIERGANPDILFSDNNTPLHIASRNFAGLTFMQMLTQQGVNVNTTNTMGSMPIHEATFVNNISAMQLLISEGVNVNVINNIGALLHIAIITGAITTATFLLRNRADINIRNNNLDTPLHLASMGKDFKMVKILLENGANINVQDYCGRTPLHRAVYNSDVITTTILLEANANINIRGLNGATPFELGEYFNNFEIRNLLWEQANKNINKNNANICSVEKNIQQQQEVLFNHKRSHKQKIKVATDSRNSKRFKVNEISQRDLDEAGTSGVTMNSNTQINIQSESSCPLPNLSEYTFIDEEMSEQNQNEKKNDYLIKQRLEDRERNDRERETLL